MSEPQPSARDLWNLRTYQLEGVVLDPNTDPPVREAVQQLLRYRTRYGDIDAPPKSPQPVAGGCEWLGECEPEERAKLLADIAALRAEVERRDEIIACEKSLGENASAMANCLERALDTAKAEAARYRAAIVECISDGRGEADMLRAIAWALLTSQERGA